MKTTMSAKSARKMIWNTMLRLDIASKPTTATSSSEPYVRRISRMFMNVPSGMKLKFAFIMSNAYTSTITTARISPIMSQTFSIFLNIVFYLPFKTQNGDKPFFPS